MKKLIFAVLMLFSSFVFADRVDITNSWPTGAYCQQVTEFFKDGVIAHGTGYARSIKQLPVEYIELLRNHTPLPKDSMWNMGWDQLTKREQDFMSKRIFEGWDVAESFKAKNQELSLDLRDKLVQTYFEGCIAKRTKEQLRQRMAPGEKVNFITAASSEKVAKPSDEVCNELKADTEIIGESISNGDPMGDLAGLAARAEDISDERRARILEMIPRAYGWDGTFVSWQELEMKGCD